MLALLVVSFLSCVTGVRAQGLPKKRELLERMSQMIDEQMFLIDTALQVANSSVGREILDPYSEIMAQFNGTIKRSDLLNLQINLMNYQLSAAKKLSLLSGFNDHFEFQIGEITQANYWEDYQSFHKEFEEYRTLVEIEIRKKEKEENNKKLISILVPSVFGFSLIVILLIIIVARIRKKISNKDGTT